VVDGPTKHRSAAEQCARCRCPNSVLDLVESGIIKFRYAAAFFGRFPRVSSRSPMRGRGLLASHPSHLAIETRTVQNDGRRDMKASRSRQLSHQAKRRIDTVDIPWSDSRRW